jgi:hypothetical protein
VKILIITQHIFPIQTPRSIRSTELIKELARRGFDVTVYAVLGNYDYAPFLNEFPNVRIKNIKIRWQFAPYNSDATHKGHIIDKILNKLFAKLIEYPNLEFMYRVPQLFKNENKYDALISIANPHQIHWGCARAKMKYPEKFPEIWVADCGDPFMNDDKDDYHKRYFSKFEKMFCSLCDYISVPHMNAIEGYYFEFRDKIHVIPQGYDFKLENNNCDDPKNEAVTFAYTGSFLKEMRDPSNFLEYLARKNMDFKFIIYTQDKGFVTPYISRLPDKLEIREPIQRTELLKTLRSMDFLVNFENVDFPACLPSKIIDYAITKRPILNLNPANLNINIIDEFLSRNYKNSYKVENLNDYHISGVVDKFISLIKPENKSPITGK